MQDTCGKDWPSIVLGTGGLHGETCDRVVSQAVTVGYRWFDTAFSYGNEADLAAALRRSGLPRSEYSIITKLPGRSHGYIQTKDRIQSQLTEMGLDYVDLYLIHWPNPRIGLFGESWHAMCEAQQQGLIRRIGVSNFDSRLINQLPEDLPGPAVVQTEIHPWWPQEEFIQWLKERYIQPMAWSPLRKGQGGILESKVVSEVASKIGCSTAAAIIMWHRSRGVIPVVKSKQSAHLKENFLAATTPNQEFPISISSDKIRLRRGGDPWEHEEF